MTSYVVKWFKTSPRPVSENEDYEAEMMNLNNDNLIDSVTHFSALPTDNDLFASTELLWKYSYILLLFLKN
jgi:hypothetical protein